VWQLKQGRQLFEEKKCTLPEKILAPPMCVLEPLLGGLGSTYTIRLRLIKST